MPNISFRDSQSFMLGSVGGVQAIAVGHNFTMTSARDLMLARPVIQLENGGPTDGDIFRFDVSGQSVMFTNQPAHCRAFQADAVNEGAAYVGIPLSANSQVFIQSGNYTGAAPGPIATAGVLCDPWNTDTLGPVPPVDSLGSSGLSVIGGLGRVGHAGGAQLLNLNCTVLRDVQLGMVCIDYHSTAANDFSGNNFAVLTSLRINQTEMLSSVDPVPLSTFSSTAQDVDLKTLSIIAPMNSNITATIQTIAGAPAGTIAGSIWALPA